MMPSSSPNNPPVQPHEALEEFVDGGYNRFDCSFMYYKNSPLLKLSPNFPLPGSQAASWITPPQLLRIPSTSEYKGERNSFMNMPGYYTSGLVKDPVLPTRSLPVDVITEILLKLPVRDILRFRCVCKLWCSLTQDHLFISRHLHERRFSNDLGIITLSCQPSVRELSVLYSVNGFHRFDMTSLFRDEFYKMSNSCNGLVCVYGGQTTYVVNPSIREVLALPKTKYEAQASVVALGQDTSTGEYKVVRLLSLGDSQIRCEIFNLGSHSWRDVQGVPSVLSSNYVHFGINPIFVNGAIHWLTGFGYDIGAVVAFDIKEENFHVIELPLEIDMHDTVLVDWDGHLCISVTPLPEIYFKHQWVSPNYKDIWVLEDYGNHRWKRHRISMQLIEDPNVASKANPLVVQDGRVLWQSGSEFHFYDLKSGRFMRPSLHVVHGYVCAQACAYKDTFISPNAIGNFGKRITGQGCP